MILCKIYLLPGGDKAREKQIAELEITNISELADISRYSIIGKSWGHVSTAHLTGLCTHFRRDNIFVLLRKALMALALAGCSPGPLAPPKKPVSVEIQKVVDDAACEKLRRCNWHCKSPYDNMCVLSVQTCEDIKLCR
jgi:hypothetical protein